MARNGWLNSQLPFIAMEWGSLLYQLVDAVFDRVLGVLVVSHRKNQTLWAVFIHFSIGVQLPGLNQLGTALLNQHLHSHKTILGSLL